MCKIVQKTRDNFRDYADSQAQLVAMFVQFKIYDIQHKYRKYCRLLQKLKTKDKEILLLIQNLYIQTYYLKQTTQYNVERSYKIINKLNSNVFQIKSQNAKNQNNDEVNQLVVNRRLLRIQIESAKIYDKVYNFYIDKNAQKQFKLTQFIAKHTRKLRLIQFQQSLSLGIIMGCLFTFLGAVIIINDINNLGLDQNVVFAQHFPIWRGASEVVFYIWILGLNVYIWEKSEINYKLIFHFDNHNLPHSRFIFLLASAFSFLYFFLFTLFMLKLAGTISTDFINFGQVFWLTFFAYIFNPLPILQHVGRFNFLKFMWKVVFSWCYPMNFLIIWVSEQLVSLSQPITDLFYTFCFFFSKDSAACKKLNPNFNSGIVFTLFVYRMYQNMKFWIQISRARPDKKFDFWAPPFLGFIRATFSMMTSVAALVNRLKLFQNAFAFWLVFAIITTLVSWYVDVRGDWGLMNHQAGTFLRPKILFPETKPFYYFMVVFDLFLRVGWVLTISPFVINSSGVWPLLFVLIISFIQIFRRGVWNALRLENQHVRNCGEYQATIKDGHILKYVEKKVQNMKSNQQEIKGETMQRIEEPSKVVDQKQTEAIQVFRKNRQLEIFKLLLQQRTAAKHKIQEDLAASKAELFKIAREYQFMKISSKFIQTAKFISFQDD